MRKIFVILFCLLVVATLINCGIPNRTKSSYDSSRTTYRIAQASYDIFLISVDRPDEAEKMYGEQRIKTVIEEGISRSYFEDGMVRVEWRPTSDDIGFIIYNKMYDSMKIVWDEARFFDEEGNIHRLIHSGIGYEERKDSHPPTIIAARGNLEDFIHPADYFRREESSGKKSYKQQDYWNRAPFLPTQIKGTAQELRAKAEPIVGKTFQVILPLQIGNVRSDYIYTFKINRVDVTEKEQRIEKNSKEGKGSGKNGRR